MQEDSHTSMLPDTPARKRPRPDSFDATEDPTLIEETENTEVVRDPVYYKLDGDCKIRVSDTLFCVHRFLLERDSPMFQTMFQLPQGDAKSQGSTDENPILLSGDTVHQWRSLFWALYALPDEIVMASKDRDYIEKLADVATLSHKYQLGAFQSWAMESILAQCEHLPGSLSCPYLRICPPHLLPIFLRLSVLFGEVDFRARVINAWVFRLTAPPLPRNGQQLPTSAFSSALLSAEENQLRGFLGQLYYARLTIVRRASNQSALLQTELPFQESEPKHLQRILRGSWFLSHAWQSLISSIPELPQDRCQQHISKCVPEWTKLWGKASTRGEATDIRCKLSWIKNYLRSHYADVDSPGGNLEASCANKAKIVVESLIAQLEQALPDYFLGPP